MEKLLKISEFAALSGLSRQLLIYYDNQGILHPKQVDRENGYRYYSPDQVQQLNALTELKALGFSLDEIKTIPEGKTAKGPLLEMLEKKRQAWQEAMTCAGYKEECLQNIIAGLRSCQSAENITQMSEQERAWLLVKMVCVEDVRAQAILSEALWL